MNDQNAPGAPVARLTIPGREPVEVAGSVTFGRDPRPNEPGARTVEILGDPLVSKSHFVVDVDGDAAGGGLIITDLGSSNGTFLHDSRGETPVPDHEWIALPADAQVEFGDQRVSVEMLAAAQPVGDATVVGGASRTDPTPVTPVSPIAPENPWGAQSDVAAANHMECHNCQRELPAGAKFCDGCGTPTTAAAVAPIAAPSTAGLWAQDSNDQAPVAPAAPVAQPAPFHPSPPVAPPGPPAQPAGQPGQPAGPPTEFGAPAFVQPAEASSSSSGLGLKIGVAVGVLVLLGIGVFGFTQLLGGDDSASSGAYVNVPAQLDEQWSESVRSDPQAAAIGNQAAYVLTGDFGEDFEVTSFAKSDGEERWSESLGVEGTFGAVVGEFGNVVVVTVCDPECEMIGLDTGSGDEVWSEGIDLGMARSAGGQIYVSDDERIASYDPATGDRLERVNAEFFLFVEDHFLVADGDDIEVFDLDLQPIFGPVEVPEDTRAVAFNGELLIFAVGDELQFIDTDGDTVMETTFGVDDINGVFVVSDDNIIVSTDEGVLAAEPVDGRADESWSQDGRGELKVIADGGTVIVVSDDDSLDAAVYDAVTGDRRFDIDDYGDAGVEFVSGQNAAVVLMRDDFGSQGDVDVVAIDWETGDELWDEGLEGLIVVDNGALLAVEENGDVTYYR